MSSKRETWFTVDPLGPSVLLLELICAWGNNCRNDTDEKEGGNVVVLVVVSIKSRNRVVECLTTNMYVVNVVLI